MTEKTRGVVLHQIKYSDSGIVVWIYTRKFGRQSFLVRGLRKKRSGKHNILFQPLAILDLVIYYKETREMQTIKEFSASYLPSGIYSNIMKSSVLMFIGEVLASVLREEHSNEKLFDFIEDSVVYFDKCTEDYSNFHLAFLASLTSYLGFEPGQRPGSREKYFDMLEGRFAVLPPAHGYYADSEISEILGRLFSSSYNESREIRLTGILRNKVLETIIRYYSLHLPGLKKINSLEVLKTVFS